MRQQRRLAARKVKERVIELLGGKCVNCGLKDWRLLQVNHCHGGGRQERKEQFQNSASQFYHALLEGKRTKEDLDLRCANCNILAEYDGEDRRSQLKGTS